MGSIVTNLAALNAERNLGSTQLKLGRVLQQLSSGYRINSAADDAAGLGISENLTAQINGTNQAIRNAQDGISMAQTAEGAMDEIHNMLQRMRELAVQGANDTLDVNARTSIGTEMIQLREEIDRIASGTTFDGKSLLTGSLSGTLDTGTSTVAVTDAVAGTLDVKVSAINVSGAQAGNYAFSTTGAGDLTLTNGTLSQTVTVSDMLTPSSQTVNFNQLGISISLNSAAGDVTNTGANIATGLNSKVVAVTAGSAAAVIQVGANATPNDTMSLSFGDVRAKSPTGLNLNTGSGVDWAGAATIVASNGAAQSLITQLDGAITAVNTARANLGADQNRLQHTVASLGAAVENLTASNSRIKDADIASLSSQMASDQVLQQAGVAVLAQANSASQAVLKLLQ